MHSKKPCPNCGEHMKAAGTHFSAWPKKDGTMSVQEVYEERCIICQNLLYADIRKSDRTLADLNAIGY